MKQLLFLLLLFPCLALAQYQGNANQKITLGEQTTADGLVWRGRLADTANLLTNKLDTSVYIVLDTGTRAMWYYRASTTPKWTRLVDSLNNLQGTLSVAKGGTGSATQNFVDLTTTQSVGGEKTFTSDIIAARFKPSATTASGTGIFTPTSTSLGFSTNGTNRVTINSSGDIGVGTTPLTGGGAAKWITLEGTAYGGGLISSVNGISKAYYYYDSGFGLFQGSVGVGVQFLSANLVALTVDTLQRVGIGIVQPTEKLHVVGNARITAVGALGGNSATLYRNSDGVLSTTSSDINKKHNVRPIIYGLSTINQLNPVNFQWNVDESEDIGFIAQDIQNIIPESIETDWDSNLIFKYEKLIPILTKAIQEQNLLIKALEQRILTLENK